MPIRWKIDPAHSEIQFKVKHLMITTVTGYFKSFNLEVETDGDDFTTASRIEFTADIDSINTNNEQRDTHLRSADFFDVENYPTLTFRSRRVESTGSGSRSKSPRATSLAARSTRRTRAATRATTSRREKGLVR